MGMYTIPFSVIAGATEKTAVAITAANATVIVREVHFTDELAASTDQAGQFRLLRAASYTGGTATTVTPAPLNRGAASTFTAKVNFTVEPTISSAEVLPAEKVASGATAVFTYEGERGIKIYGVEVLQMTVKAPATRTAPFTGYLLVEGD